ncbi:MAG: hypothetical protein H6Q68_2709 [Firmicutes bacterium]|nr:hypothetical protein [Bacillota bacterium]
MNVKSINNIEITVAGQISEDEISTYLTQLQAKNKFKIIKADIKVDGEYVDINYQTESIPFNRIRRITGYLTGSTDSWNNAKYAELKDRVKHG